MSCSSRPTRRSQRLDSIYSFKCRCKNVVDRLAVLFSVSDQKTSAEWSCLCSFYDACKMSVKVNQRDVHEGINVLGGKIRFIVLTDFNVSGRPV